MNAERTVDNLKLAITGNVADQKLLGRQNRTDLPYGGTGIDAGGRIALGTATTAKVSVVDATGRVLHSPTNAVTASVDIPPTAAGVVGPLLVTVTEISNAAHTLTVYWSVKK